MMMMEPQPQTTRQQLLWKWLLRVLLLSAPSKKGAMMQLFSSCRTATTSSSSCSSIKKKELLVSIEQDPFNVLFIQNQEQLNTRYKIWFLLSSLTPETWTRSGEQDFGSMRSVRGSKNHSKYSLLSRLTPPSTYFIARRLSR
jgi:hypothetical protein